MLAQLHTTSDQRAEQGRFVHVDNIRWHIKTVGQGPVCLLIHGTGASMHTWDNLVTQLSAHFTLIMVDLPGHAQTLTPRSVDLSLPRVAACLRSLLDSEAIKPKLIVGHSAGAAIMLQLCLQKPMIDTTLISINGAIMPLSGVAGYLFSPLAKMSANSDWMPRLFAYRAKNPRNIKKLLNSTGSVVDQRSFDCYQQLFSDEIHVSGVLRFMANWKLEELLPQLSQLKQAIVLIAASDDRTVPLRDSYRLMQHLPDAQLSVIKSRGHLVHEEDASAVAHLIIDRSSIE